jgi:hypothetical protein
MALGFVGCSRSLSITRRSLGRPVRWSVAPAPNAEQARGQGNQGLGLVGSIFKSFRIRTQLGYERLEQWNSGTNSATLLRSDGDANYNPGSGRRSGDRLTISHRGG